MFLNRCFGNLAAGRPGWQDEITRCAGAFFGTGFCTEEAVFTAPCGCGDAQDAICSKSRARTSERDGEQAGGGVVRTYLLKQCGLELIIENMSLQLKMKIDRGMPATREHGSKNMHNDKGRAIISPKSVETLQGYFSQEPLPQSRVYRVRMEETVQNVTVAMRFCWLELLRNSTSKHVGVK